MITKVKQEILYGMTNDQYAESMGRPYVTYELLEAFVKNGMQGFFAAMTQPVKPRWNVDSCDVQVAATLLERGHLQVCIRGNMYGLPCQILVDWLHEDGAIVSIEPAEEVVITGTDLLKWSFHRALYREVMQAVPPCFVVLVGDETISTPAVISISNDCLFDAECSMVRAFGRLRKHIESIAGENVPDLTDKEMQSSPLAKKPNGSMPPRPRKVQDDG